MLPDPFLPGPLADGSLDAHQGAAALFDDFGGDLFAEVEGFGAVFVGVAEGAHPIESGFADEVGELGEVLLGFAREADDEGGSEDDAGDGGADLFDGLEEDVGVGSALHALEDVAGGVLQGDIEVFADVVVAGDGVEEAAGDLVGIGVEEAEPADAVNFGEAVEELGEAVFEVEIFAVTGGVLANEGDFADALLDELMGLGDDGLETAGAELAAKIGDDTETAGMVAALGDLDVGGGSGGGAEAGGVFVVEILGKGGLRAIPLVAGETALGFAEVAFGAGGDDGGRSRRSGSERSGRSRVDSGGDDGGQDRKGRGSGFAAAGSDAGGGEDALEFAGADDGVDLRNILLDFVAITLDQASGNDEFPGFAVGLEAGHLEDGVDGFLFGGVDEGAGIHDEHVGGLGIADDAGAGVIEEAHHNFAIDEILGAAEADESDAHWFVGGGVGI